VRTAVVRFAVLAVSGCQKDCHFHFLISDGLQGPPPTRSLQRAEAWDMGETEKLKVTKFRLLLLIGTVSYFLESMPLLPSQAPLPSSQVPSVAGTCRCKCRCHHCRHLHCRHRHLLLQMPLLSLQAPIITGACTNLRDVVVMFSSGCSASIVCIAQGVQCISNVCSVAQTAQNTSCGASIAS